MPRRAPAHLAFIRMLPCIICARQPSQAAHIRIGTDGGTSLKPSDMWAVPLCADHHAIQHMFGERTFWESYDPRIVAAELWTITGDVEAGERIVLRERARL
jgi:hypothetical protein